MKLFSEKVKHTLTNSSLNILQVENFEEIFFGVYEIEINKAKYLAEKVSEHKGNPVVSVPVEVKGEQIFYPFVLSKGKQEIIFNEDIEAIDVYSVPVPVQYTPIEKIDLVPIFEDTVPEIIVNNKQEILEQIEQAKAKAKQEINKLNNQKRKELQQESDTRKKLLNKTLTDAKQSMVEEFVKISHRIKDELIDTNDSRFVEIAETIDNKINDLTNAFSKTVYENFEESIDKFDSKLKSMVKEIHESIHPKVDKQLTVIATDIVEKVSELKKDITKSVSSLEKSINKKLNTKADTTILSEVSNIKNANIELHDAINKGVNKALSRVGNISTKVDEFSNKVGNELTEFDKKIDEKVIQIEETLTEKVSNIREKVNNEVVDIKVEIVDTINEKVSKISQSISKKVDAIDKAINSKIATKAEATDVVTLAEKIGKKVGESLSQIDATNVRLGQIQSNIDKEITQLDEKLDTKVTIKVVDGLKKEVVTLEKANLKLNSNISKGVKKLLTHTEKVDKKVDDLTISIAEELDTRLLEVEENVTAYYTAKLKMLEEHTFEITEETRQIFMGLVQDSRDELLAEVRKLKNEKPIQYIVESKGISEVGPLTTDFDTIKKDFDKHISGRIDNEVTRLRKYIAVYSGGGSVAMQFADGGTMNGNLIINGDITVTGGLNLSGYNPTNWNNTYTIVQSNSANWNTAYYSLSDKEDVSNKVTVISGSNINNTYYPTTSAVYDFVQDNITFVGCELLPSIVDNGDGTVSISGGTYVFASDSEGFPPFHNYDNIYTGVLVLADESVNWVVARYNGGSPDIAVVQSTATINNQTVFPVFLIARSGNTLSYVDLDSESIGLPNKLSLRFARTRRIEVETGGLILGSTSIPVDRTLTITAGTVWYAANNNFLPAFNSSLSAYKFYYHSGGVWTSALSSQLNNTQYDNGTNLVTLTNNRYAVSYVFRSIGKNNDNTYVILGNANHTLGQAQSAPLPANLPPELSISIFVGRIIIQRDATTATQTDSAFTTILTYSGVTDHEALANLMGGAPNDHQHLTTTELTYLQSLQPALRTFGTNVLIGSLSSTSLSTVQTSKLTVADSTLAGSGGLSGSALSINQTWNTTGTPTALLVDVTDTASNANSLLANWKVNGVSKTSINKNGSINVVGTPIMQQSSLSIGVDGILVSTLQLGNSVNGLVIINSAGNKVASFGINGHTVMIDSIELAATGTSKYAQGDTILARDAANIFGQRNVTNAQTFRWYQTFTDSSNYARGSVTANTNATIGSYVQLAAESAGTGSADIDLILTPKGTGAIIAGPLPDGTSAAGNARGNNAVDLQTSRAANTQVALGNISVIGGGNSNTNSGSFGVIGGGNGNTVNSSAGSILGGTRGLTRAVIGLNAKPFCADPISVTVGGTQATELVLGRQTTDATPTVLCSNASVESTANQLTLPVNSAYFVEGKVISTVTAGGDTSSWKFLATISKGANNASTRIVGTPTIAMMHQDGGAATWTLEVLADTTNGALQVRFTGEAGKTIRTVCHLESAEVTF